MTRRARCWVLGLAAAVYLLGLGGLVGTAVERWRFGARRAALLEGYETQTRRWRELLMEVERGAWTRTAESDGTRRSGAAARPPSP